MMREYWFQPKKHFFFQFFIMHTKVYLVDDSVYIDNIYILEKNDTKVTLWCYEKTVAIRIWIRFNSISLCVFAYGFL